MYLLSVTFHCVDFSIKKWENYQNSELKILLNNLMFVEKYALFSVHSELISEGKNYSLLLFFETELLKNDFLENEMKHISDYIFTNFQEDVMIFKTSLDPIFSTL